MNLSQLWPGAPMANDRLTVMVGRQATDHHWKAFHSGSNWLVPVDGMLGTRS